MILLYTLLLFLLTTVKFLVSWRARYLERKFARIAGSVEKLVREQDAKQGSSYKYDACLSAKRSYELGSLVQQRDAVESRYLGWQSMAERLTRWAGNVRGWKGRKLPYTLGVLDVSMLLYVIDYLGVGQYLSAQNVMQTVATWFNQ
jgi:hypothetical protein